MKWILSLRDIIKKRVDVFGNQYFLFGVFGTLNYPTFYIIWIYFAYQTYENFLLRLIATLLCLPLIFHKKWPRKLDQWKPLYWYVTLTVCLPFFFTFMLLKNNASEVWLMSTTIVMVWLMLLVDAVSFIILLLIGTGSAIIIFSITSIAPFYKEGLLGLIFQYFGSLAVVLVFARQKDRLYERTLRLKAEESSKTKSEFIANMSHDIRTPMTGMLGMGQMIYQKVTDPEIKEQARLLVDSTNELLNLLNSILEMARLEVGEMDQEPKTFNLNAIIDHNVKLLMPVAKDKNLDFKVSSLEDTGESFIGYHLLIDRVLLNLLSNAIKFTEKGFVAISVEKIKQFDNQAVIQIVIEDTGIGIPEDKYEEIFKNFSRLTPSYDGIYKGYGIGLYAVKKYLEKMKGSVDLQSELGKGTRFVVALPLTIVKSVSEPTPKLEVLTSMNDNKNLNYSRVHILVVEDNLPAAMVVQSLLKSISCVTCLARTGKEAVERASHDKYDLILMDIGLPDFSGVEATKKIRSLKDKRCSQIPIIALTGHGDDPQRRQEAFAAGMQEVLTKPATLPDLEAIIRHYVPKNNKVNNE